ncbi:MAG: hypothetical protein JST93_03175 [Acidobacteria bacterium]|nr:hypothetical protein [Acidobacteriota bacterium]
MTRSEQSRINGARSRGATTPEGRARSALNHTKHGMHSSAVVLETESKEIFHELANLYHGVFLPLDPFESDLVNSLVQSRWKIRRLEAIHSAELNLAITEHRAEHIQKYGPGIQSPDLLHALAYRTNGKYLETLDKHLDRQERLFTRTYRNLSKYRKDHPLPSIEELQDLDQDFPSNTETQNEAFEPETPPDPTPEPVPEIEKERFEPEKPDPVPTEPQPEPKPLPDPPDRFALWPPEVRFMVDNYPPIREMFLEAIETETKLGRIKPYKGSH